MGDISASGMRRQDFGVDGDGSLHGEWAINAAQRAAGADRSDPEFQHGDGLAHQQHRGPEMWFGDEVSDVLARSDDCLSQFMGDSHVSKFIRHLFQKFGSSRLPLSRSCFPGSTFFIHGLRRACK